MFARRRGSMLPFAIVMMGVILALVVGMMAWFNSSLKRSQEDRWRAVAADAAETGLSMMLAWARATVDKTRTTPPEWDVGDGVTANPLKSMYESAEVRENAPAGGLAASGRKKLTVGSPADPVEAGDIIDEDGAGEFVVGRYGDYFATLRVRLQPFRITEGAPRQYKVGVAGRVRVYNSRGETAGPFRGSKLVADRVVVATIGKQPLSRFAALVDIDQVYNWAPGEIVEGPVHVNRGYVDTPAAIRPGNFDMTMGRSKMVLNVPGPGFTAVGGITYPQFTDEITLTASDATDYDKAVKVSPSSVEQVLSSAAYTADLARKIFKAPENQGKVAGGKAGPRSLKDPIAMPPNSRARLAGALGIPEGRGVNTLPWFRDLPDGVYVPTASMSDGTANTYVAGEPAAGGIYVRGEVEVMRMAVKGDRSYYVFQMGYNRAGWPRRCYVVAADRAALTMKVVALQRNRTLDQCFPTPATMAATIDGMGDTAGSTLDDFSLIQLQGRPNNPADVFTTAANTGGFPFSGLIFVDYSLHDPLRTDDNITLRRPGHASHSAPLTGQILSLGDPAPVKRPMSTTAFPATLAAGEVVCTEATTGTPPKASKLMIIAAGDIFIQNHLLVKSVVEQSGTTDTLDDLRRDRVSLTQTRDLLGIVSDKQILMGLAAPSNPTRGQPGLAVTGALAALGDPHFNYREAKNDDFPTDIANPGSIAGRAYRFRGSFNSEGLMEIMGVNDPERYDCVYPTAAGLGQYLNQPRATLASRHFDTEGDNFRPLANTTRPYSPLYVVDGPVPALAALGPPNPNPNREIRGNLVVFGSLVMKKRGAFGAGNVSYDKDFRYDQRLLTIAPPLFPNSLNITTNIARLDALGLPNPHYAGPQAPEVDFLTH